MDLDGSLCNSINVSEYFIDIEGFILWKPKYYLTAA